MGESLNARPALSTAVNEATDGKDKAPNLVVSSRETAETIAATDAVAAVRGIKRSQFLSEAIKLALATPTHYNRRAISEAEHATEKAETLREQFHLDLAGKLYSYIKSDVAIESANTRLLIFISAALQAAFTIAIFYFCLK